MAQIISLRIKQNSLEYVYNRAIPIYDVSIIPNFYRNISKRETYHDHIPFVPGIPINRKHPPIDPNFYRNFF